MSILLIDIGNTRLKWAIAANNDDLHSDFVDQGANMNNSPNQFAQLDLIPKKHSIEKII